MNRGRYSNAMTSSISKTVAQPLMSTLNIAVSEDAVPLQIHQPLLAYLYFGDTYNKDLECLAIQTSLDSVGSKYFSQYWLTEHDVQQKQYKNVRYAASNNMLFGHVLFQSINENNFQELCEQAYSEIFECLHTSGCSHLLRTWNFFPEITRNNSEQRLANRYDLFCQSRLRAVQASKIEHKIYPAATVIGNHNGCFQIYFFASDTPGIAVENPRQTSAYNYPTSVAHAQPLFSRGILKDWGNRTHFYVSGTASIVGYKTLHLNDVGAQLNEAINNVETLIAHTNEQHKTKLNAQDDLLYMKVYIRRREDVTQINQVLAARLSSTTPRILLLGDMCRDGLLVEIEAFYQT